MKTMTIRGIDPEVFSAVKKKAERAGESMNQTVIKILKEAVGFSSKLNYKTYMDLDYLAGTWDRGDEELFNENTKAFEEIDKEMWD